MKISPITILGPLIPNKIKGRYIEGFDIEPSKPEEPERENDDDNDGDDVEEGSSPQPASSQSSMGDYTPV